MQRDVAWLLCPVCFPVSHRAVPERVWRDIQRHMLCMHIDLCTWTVPEQMQRDVAGLLCPVHFSVSHRAVPERVWRNIQRHLFCMLFVPNWPVPERMWRDL
jgi:hypothetical protein